jgi:hypothetical protein
MRFFQRSPPVCIRGSPYAYGDPHMHNYTYGDTKLNFPYAHNFIMHTGSDEKSPYAYRDAKIPVCIRGLVSIRSPYAYRDCANPRMHTGIKINPRMHTGITYKSPYAYWDYMTCNPRMHTGIDLDHRMHTGIFAIPVCIRGLNLIPVCIRGSHVCNPLMHTGIKM